MNKKIATRILTFCLFLTLISSPLHSQSLSSDTLFFYKAKEKFNNSVSGIIYFKVSEINLIDFFLDNPILKTIIDKNVEFYFVKQKDNKTSYYIKTTTSSVADKTYYIDELNEFVYHNDTLLNCGAQKGKPTFIKKYQNHFQTSYIQTYFIEALIKYQATTFLYS